MKLILVSQWALLLAPLAGALPGDHLFVARRQTTCADDKCLKVVKNPRVSVIARAFCSSFIATTVTVQSTITQSVVTVPGTTFSTTLPLTTTISKTITEVAAPATVTTPTTITTTVTEPVPVAKRDLERRGIPAWLKECINSSAVSSACTCLITTAPTSTVTVQTTVVATATGAATTVTITEVQTVEEMTTITLPPTNTVTVPSTITVTKTTCAANAPAQVVRNSNIEVAGAGNLPPPPWTYAEQGNQVGIDLNFCGRAGANSNCNAGVNCRCFFVNADSPGGKGQFQQTLAGVCPGKTYNFEAYIGRSDNLISGSKVVTTVSAKLDDTVLFPAQIFCQVGQPCPLPGGSGPYIKVGPIPVTPDRTSPVLTFEFITDIPANAGIFSVDVFVDDITLTAV